MNKEFLHSKTDANGLNYSSSDSESSNTTLDIVPEHIKDTNQVKNIRQNDNPSLKNSIKQQLKSLKNNLKIVNELISNTHTVNIQGLRLTHKGSINKRFLQNNKGISNDVLKNNKVALLANVENYHIQFERIDFNTYSDAVIMVKGGELIVKKCLINMNLLTRESQLVTCAIIADSHTTVSVESCELFGSKYFDTLGVVLRNANFLMKNSIVNHFRSGGMLMYTKAHNIVKIYKSQFRNNNFFGIQILGNSSAPSIQYCTIENNSCVGIQICTANKCNIRKNIISLNKNGIEIISADPLICENELSENFRNGILVKSLENLVSMPTIQGNKIFYNSWHGINCIGMTNKALIRKNTITFNKKSGIQVSKNATVTILDNTINKNIMQGVIIQECASAHLERNEISSNIKANIAFGGEGSCNTNIINNKILNGRCEGIFMINCGRCIITRNEISGNYYGILAITSIPIVQHNCITKNKKHAIMLLKKSKATLKFNVIKNNQGVGIFIRDDSCVNMSGSIIDGNHLGVVQERKFNPKKHSKQVKKGLMSLTTLDFEVNQALKSSKREREDPNSMEQNQVSAWSMENLEANNTINDKMRVPFDFKCLLI